MLAALLASAAAPCTAQDLVTNLQVHWTFDGHANDSSPNARHLTTVGTVSYAAGKIGSAAQNLDASNHFTLSSLGWLQGATQWFASAWYFESAYAADDCGWSTSNNSLATLTGAYPHDTSGGNGFRLLHASGNHINVNSGAPAAGQWNHYVVAGNGKLWVNSVEVVDAADITLNATLSRFSIGRLALDGDPFGDQSLTGHVDDFWLFVGRNPAQADVDALFAYTGQLNPPRAMATYRRMR